MRPFALNPEKTLVISYTHKGMYPSHDFQLFVEPACWNSSFSITYLGLVSIKKETKRKGRKKEKEE